jgi:hypothetical protein
VLDHRGWRETAASNAEDIPLDCDLLVVDESP